MTAAPRPQALHSKHQVARRTTREAVIRSSTAALTNDEARALAFDAMQWVALPQSFQGAVVPATLVTRQLGSDRAPPGRSLTLVDLSCCLII